MALLGAKHTTFFDRDNLGAGGEYHSRIQDEIVRCDAFVFLVSAHSVAKGGYARSELKQARARWPHPHGRVLPVLCDDKSHYEVPEYLMQVTLMEPEGNLAADVLFALERLRGAGSMQGDKQGDKQGSTQGSTQGGAPPPPPPGPASATLRSTHYLHNTMVASPQGPAPGMQISVTVDVHHAAGRMVQVAIKFAYLNGPPLRANDHEAWFRDTAGIVTCGTAPRPVSAASESLGQQLIGMPYYALNFAPMQGMGQYALAYTVLVFADQQLIGQSMPQAFSFRW